MRFIRQPELILGTLIVVVPMLAIILLAFFAALDLL